MFKTLLLTGAAFAAVPAFAQTATPPAEETTVIESPATGSTATPPAEQTVPADTADADSTAETGSTNEATGVAAVVDAEWATYDADANGQLSKAEFSAWMTKLTAADPSSRGGQSASAYSAAAFAQADKDKSAAVTKTELTTFLQG